MAERKNYWYIIVLQNYGPVFVTGIPERTTAEWDRLKKPMKFTATYAKEVAWALRLNGYTAYAVCNTYELGNQPYIYDIGEFKWEWSEEAIATGRYANQEE